MRIALISDIHGNLVSLEAVLADIERQQVDEIICLGDVATLGPQPREVVLRLQSLGCACVMGNHDSFLLNPDLGRTYMDAAWFAANVAWCIQQLQPPDFAYLRTFQPLIKAPLDMATTLLCFHGSPQSNTDMILATTSPAKLNKMLAGHAAMVMAGGHTHVQMVRQHQGCLIINAGSVGMPFAEALFANAPRILPWAEYAVVKLVDGVLSVDLRRVPVDLAALTQASLASNMPDADEWLKNWILPQQE